MYCWGGIWDGSGRIVVQCDEELLLLSNDIFAPVSVWLQRRSIPSCPLITFLLNLQLRNLLLQCTLTISQCITFSLRILFFLFYAHFLLFFLCETGEQGASVNRTGYPRSHFLCIFSLHNFFLFLCEKVYREPVLKELGLINHIFFETSQNWICLQQF